MSSFLKSHTLVICFALCLAGFLSFWTLEKDRCVRISSKEGINIEINCKPSQ